MDEPHATNSPVQIAWEREGRLFRTSGTTAATTPGTIALTLAEPGVWLPDEAVYLVTSSGDHDIVTVAQFSRGTEETAVFDILAPWRRYNRRRELRYPASLRVLGRAPGAAEWQRGRAVNISVGGLRLATATPPTGDTLEVALGAFDHAAVLVCEVMGVHDGAAGVEVRLRFRDNPPQALAVVQDLVGALERLENQGPDLLAA